MSDGPRPTTPAPNPALPRRTLLGAALVGPTASRDDAAGHNTEAQEPSADALILSLCRRVRQLETSNALNDAAWDSAVRQLSTLPARSRAGILAKAELLRSFLPTAPNSPAAYRASPDEQLLASLLEDLLGHAVVLEPKA